MKRFLPILLTVSLLTACSSNKKEVTDIKDIHMDSIEESTEVVSEEEITFTKKALPNYGFVSQFEFKESATAALSAVSETGFTIDFAEGNSQGYITVNLSKQNFEEYDRQTQDIAHHVEGAYVQNSHILEGFREVVYTNTTDSLGEVTRLIEYKPYSETETLSITIFIPAENYDDLIDKAVEVVQSLKV